MLTNCLAACTRPPGEGNEEGEGNREESRGREGDGRGRDERGSLTPPDFQMDCRRLSPLDRMIAII